MAFSRRVRGTGSNRQAAQSASDAGAAPTFFQAAEYSLKVFEAAQLRIQRDGQLGHFNPFSPTEALIYGLRSAALAAGGGGIADEVEEAETALLLNLGSSEVCSDAAAALERHLEARRTEAPVESRMKAGQALWGPPCALDSSLGTADVVLTGGARMPALGFGTTSRYYRDAKALVEAVMHAARLGYTHFETAQGYGNEELVGAALRMSGVERSELFIASKLSQPQDYGTTETPACVQAQLERIQVEYLDLYYLHSDIGDEEREYSAWRALEALVDAGTVRHLGLSNYTVEGITRILSFARVRPAVLQTKYDCLHPGYQIATPESPDLIAWARREGLAVVGYSVMSGWPSLLQAPEDPHVAALARRLGRTPWQVLLRHALGKGIAVVISSVDPRHLAEDSAVFDFAIPAEDAAFLDCLAGLAALSPPPWLPSLAPAAAPSVSARGGSAAHEAPWETID